MPGRTLARGFCRVISVSLPPSSIPGTSWLPETGHPYPHLQFPKDLEMLGRWMNSSAPLQHHRPPPAALVIKSVPSGRRDLRTCHHPYMPHSLALNLLLVFTETISGH